jgi:hypothetical protein
MTIAPEKDQTDPAKPEEGMVRPDDERIARIALDLANHLTRRYRWKLYAATGLLTILGILHGLLFESPTAFPRYGALIALVTFWYASAQQKYIAMLQHRAEPIAREVGQELGKDPAKTTSLLERLRTSVQSSFSRDYLVCGTIGVVVWGFGDLPLLAILPNTP